MLDPVGKRILDYLEEAGMSKAAFAQAAGINKASLSHLERGRNKASLALVEASILQFPEIDLNWLITGKGTRSKQTDSSDADDKEVQPVQKKAQKASSSAQKKPSESATIQQPPSLLQHATDSANASNDRDSLSADHDESLTVLYPDGTYASFRPRR